MGSTARRRQKSTASSSSHQPQHDSAVGGVGSSSLRAASHALLTGVSNYPPSVDDDAYNQNGDGIDERNVVDDDDDRSKKKGDKKTSTAWWRIRQRCTKRQLVFIFCLKKLIMIFVVTVLWNKSNKVFDVKLHDTTINASGVGDSSNAKSGNALNKARDIKIKSDLSHRQSSQSRIIIQPGHLLSNNNTLYLPSALLINSTLRNLPYTQKCCKLASSSNEPKRLLNRGVCYTPRACTDTLYPFRTAEEKEFFVQRDAKTLVGMESQELWEGCAKMGRMLKPPFKWCHQWLDRNDTTKTAAIVNNEDHHVINPIKANLPPPGCSLLSEGGNSGSYQHLLLFPQAKLAFCGIPKNGISKWLQFLRFIIGAKDYQDGPNEKEDVKYFRFDKLQKKSMMKVLNDPSWTFAAFLREPSERLLSAYLDKWKHSGLELEQNMWLYEFEKGPSFEEFVREIAKNRTQCPLPRGRKGRNKLWGVDWCTDPHWRPQTFSCGLSEFLPRFSYIGTLDNIANQTRQLLQGVGLWETYGKYYHWNTKSNDAVGIPPPKLNVGDELIGFQQLPRTKTTTVKHSYHSTQSQSKVQKYYTPELLQIVKRLYQHDFELWDLIKDEEDMQNGSDLAVKLSKECADKALVLDGLDQ